MYVTHGSRATGRIVHSAFLLISFDCQMKSVISTIERRRVTGPLSVCDVRTVLIYVRRLSSACTMHLPRDSIQTMHTCDSLCAVRFGEGSGSPVAVHFDSRGCSAHLGLTYACQIVAIDLRCVIVDRALSITRFLCGITHVDAMQTQVYRIRPSVHVVRAVMWTLGCTAVATLSCNGLRKTALAIYLRLRYVLLPCLYVDRFDGL